MLEPLIKISKDGWREKDQYRMNDQDIFISSGTLKIIFFKEKKMILNIKEKYLYVHLILELIIILSYLNCILVLNNQKTIEIFYE